MNPLAAILLLLVAAKGLGELLERAGYPSIIGEIGAGALLGPAVLNIVRPEATIEVFADVGLITLLFMSGAQLNLRTFARSGRAGFWIACAGVAIPLAAGAALGFASGFDLISSLFIGIALSITSIGISVRTLIDLRQLKSDIGLLVVSASVIDDVIGIILLGMLTSLTMGEGYGQGMIITLLLAILFFAVLLTIGRRVIVWAFRASHRAHIHEMPYSVALICGLLCALAGDAAGLHYAIGAFLAGLILGDSIRSDRSLYDNLSDLAFGFFVTLFFASIGLLFPPSLGGIPLLFLIALILAAFGSKILGGFAGSLRTLRDPRRSLVVGLGLVPRGEIALVVAKISLSAGLITAALFSSVTIMVIVTVFATPFLMARGFSWIRR
ncbi:MAG: glutathione-regulated potassium-efflux system protein KefB [Methanoregulaceae archaeon PtaU1.Bin059]|nr:MAG: glutathione-regulated potassium-efflux system protein KefB [Methanoregulaceae archaeon PtaB.Bin152]OPY39374.1 MAG: glutathione-regulated potassium-efflux system protein KefB [Methanoregulaceae archaeon PtaU1.Bin059]